MLILGIAFMIMSLYVFWIYVYLPKNLSIIIEGTIVDYEVIEQEEGLTYVAKVIYEDPMNHETKEIQLSKGLPFKKETPIKTILQYQATSKDIAIKESFTPYTMTAILLMIIGVIMILLPIGGWI